MGVFSTNEPMTNMGVFAGSMMSADQSMDTEAVMAPLVDEYRNSASDAFLSTIEKFGTDEMIDAVQKELFTDPAGTEMTMMNIMTTAIATYMARSGGTQPDEGSLKGMIELMTPVTDENIIEIGSMIRDLSQDGDRLMSFFDEDMVA